MNAISISFNSSFYSPAPVPAPAAIYAFTGQPVRPAVPPAPVQEAATYEIDCQSKECEFYMYCVSTLERYAANGYPLHLQREYARRPCFGPPS